MGKLVEMCIPDIGDFRDVPVVEVCVAAGDVIAPDETVVTLESDKATLDVPATLAGRVADVRIAEGDRVSEGTVILLVETDAEEGSEVASDVPLPASISTSESASAPAPASASEAVIPALPAAAAPRDAGTLPPHASPAIRKFARELGVDIGVVTGTGPKWRITREDVQAFVKRALTAASPTTGMSGLGLDMPPWPVVDYAAFGPIERQPLTRITRISGPSLARNATIIPHVTNFDDADITDLEAFRKAINTEASDGTKLSILPFVVKACVAALKAFPAFNSSLDGDALVLKRYYNIGVAADTPEGLVVPVIKAADGKGIAEIGAEMAELAAAARAGRLKPGDMQGATFTISSLGGIGGTNFTPIINAPEVAILGMTRAAIRPVWDGVAFQPRLIQPLSLSWDHRAVDGVAAARFLVHVKRILADFRRISL